MLLAFKRGWGGQTASAHYCPSSSLFFFKDQYIYKIKCVHEFFPGFYSVAHKPNLDRLSNTAAFRKDITNRMMLTNLMFVLGDAWDIFYNVNSTGFISEVSNHHPNLICPSPHFPPLLLPSVWLWAGPGRLLFAAGWIHLYSGLPAAVWDTLL